MAEKKKLRALGGDIFAGLFSMGVQSAGYELVGHVEHTGYGHATARLNFPDLPLHVGLASWPEPKRLGKVDLMYANPPCAAWSSARGANQGSWRDHVERLAYIENLATYGLELRPKAWVWESVTNAWRHGRAFIDHIAELWLREGYSVTVVKQNNMFLGVPQNRPRILVTAHRHPLGFPPLTDVITVSKALKGVKATAAEKKEAALSARNYGETWVELWNRAERFNGNLRRVYQTMDEDERTRLVKTKPSFMNCRLRLHHPAPVMMAREKRLHPTEPRQLTWAEALALCGLPPGWRTAGSITQGFYELSRAVMPGVGRWIAAAVAAGLDQRPLKPPRYQLYDCEGGPDKITVVDLVVSDEARRGEPPPTWRDRRNEITTAVKSFEKVADEQINQARKRSDHLMKKITAHTVANGAARRVGSGARIRELLQKGWNEEKILETIHREFPQSKATKADVSWNRGRLKREGINL